VTSEATEEQLAELMVGREVVFTIHPEPVESEGRVLLQVESLSAQDDRGVLAVREVSLEVHDHEILGIAGVQGNGQKELVEVICGLRRPTGGRVLVGDAEVTGQSPRRLGARGLVHIPEDRHLRGLVEQFSVSVPTLSAPARTLSGGNQQRLILARELTRGPQAVVAMQPTRGLDVGGMEFVWEQFLKMRKEGVGILLVSMDLDEVMMLSDRIAVMYQGKIVGVFQRGEAEKRKLGLLMLGGQGEVA